MVNITPSMLDLAIQLAAKIQATALLISSECAAELTILGSVQAPIRPILVTKDDEREECSLLENVTVLRAPRIELDRVGRLKIAVITALAEGLIKVGDVLVCLTGPRNTRDVDTVMVLEVGEEFELLNPGKTSEFTKDLPAAIFEALLSLAIELANEGREGRPVGAIFILGDAENVSRLSRQLIYNPFEGHPEEKRSIFNPEARETVKELSSIDGAFLVREDGVVLAAGRHLNVASTHEDFPRGWGARHAAAAAITEVTKATAITISESTGMVSIFKNGKVVTTIERPRVKVRPVD
ncbi:MAG TPA: diadenylate cyclase [Syntrophobacteria bacterium]|jgi:DNA integrity scanning protein DisA with diadenylate cyclase activity|nr:diadenylate cyclase [Syntrophobacteria bacterium]